MSNSTPEPSTSEVEPSVEYEWSEQEEKLMTLWSDRALCYRLLHEHAHKERSKTLLWFTLPVIILSTFTGTANFGIQSLVSPQYLNVAQSIIGILNLTSGLLTTIQNFLRISERSEGHRQSFTGWGQLHRNIYTELCLERRKRKPCKEALQRFRMEYDRLIAVSPPLTRTVIMQVMNQLSIHPDIILPEECNH